MTLRDNIFFILYKPSVPGNIGASARAMKTMGFKNLRLIDAADHLSDDAKMLAHGSHDILISAGLYKTFDEAVSDLDFLVSTTANTAKNAKVDYVSSKALVNFIQNKEGFTGNIGIIFGKEESGLPGEIIRRSNIGLTIPAQESYPSLNLSQAVMIIAYELYTGIQTGEIESKSESQPDASWKALEKNTHDILLKSGIKPLTPLYHRIIERMSMMSGTDARLVHSIVNRIKDKLR